MKINYYGSLREHTGEAGIAWEAAAVDLEELLDALSARYGEAFRRIVLNEGEIGAGVTVLINGRDARGLGGLSAPLSPRDTVYLLPMAGGG